MRTIFLAAIIAIFVSAPVSAKTAIPIFDVNNRCEQKTAGFDDPLWMRGRCIDKEQRAYDRLKNEWEVTDEQVRRDCVRHLNNDEKGTYRGILDCLSQKHFDAEMKSKRFQR